MKTFKTIILLPISFILLTSCEEIQDKEEIISVDTIPNPIFGRWEFQGGRTELFLTSAITQQAIDYTQQVEGSIEVSGSHEVTFNYFTNDRTFWSGTPYYLLTKDSPWIFPRKELRLIDTSGTKSAELSVSAHNYYSDSIGWEYSNLTGNLHIPSTQLYLSDRSDSVTVWGDASVPMLTLEAGVPTLAFFMDTIQAGEPFQKIEFLQFDSILIWEDTLLNYSTVGQWYTINDSLSFLSHEDSSTYFYSIQEDTLTLISPKMIETNFGMYEMYADLESSSILDGWGFLCMKYYRSD